MYRKTMKPRAIVTPLAAALIGVFSVVAAPAASAEVEIIFAGNLSGKMSKVSSIDAKREKVFREYRAEGTRPSLKPRASLNRSRFAGTEWGNERLIPNLDDYGAQGLLEAMMERGIKEANPAFDGNIVVEIEKLKIKNFPLASMKSFNTRMVGTVKMMDAAGSLVAEHKISAYLVPEYDASTSYDGPDYAYLPGALDTRIGPIAAEFTEKALKEMFPGYDAPGLVVLK